MCPLNLSISLTLFSISSNLSLTLLNVLFFNVDFLAFVISASFISIVFP
nr:MAG TPA: hypothetical protein [Caudoviricetes sp.]